jgi:hypothetical protein
LGRNILSGLPFLDNVVRSFVIICLTRALSIPQIRSALVFQVTVKGAEYCADTRTEQRCFRVPTNRLTRDRTEPGTGGSALLGVVTAGVCTSNDHHRHND